MSASPDISRPPPTIGEDFLVGAFCLVALSRGALHHLPKTLRYFRVRAPLLDLRGDHRDNADDPASAPPGGRDRGIWKARRGTRACGQG
jgi:hypothetical protein